MLHGSWQPEFKVSSQQLGFNISATPNCTRDKHPSMPRHGYMESVRYGRQGFALIMTMIIMRMMMMMMMSCFLTTDRKWETYSGDQQSSRPNRNNFKGSSAVYVFYVVEFHNNNRPIFCFRRPIICQILTTVCTLWVNKKQATIILPITSPNVGWFSKFFHWQIH